MGKNKMMRVDQFAEQKFPSEIYVADLIPKGWTVIKDVSPTTFRIGDLKFKSFLHGGEDQISGDTMRQRAVSLKGNLGLVDGKFLLAHQDEIPTELRVTYIGMYIILPGTVLRDPGGRLCVPCLNFYCVRWYLIFVWLDNLFNGLIRFACNE